MGNSRKLIPLLYVHGRMPVFRKKVLFQTYLFGYNQQGIADNLLFFQCRLNTHMGTDTFELYNVEQTRTQHCISVRCVLILLHVFCAMPAKCVINYIFCGII